MNPIDKYRNMPTPARSTHEEALELLKRYLKPAALTELLEGLHTAEAFEGALLVRRKTSTRSGKPGVRLELTQDSIEHIITQCHLNLPEEEFLELLLALGDIFKIHGDLNRAEQVFSSVLSTTKNNLPAGIVAEAYMKRGEIHSRMGRWKESVSDLNRSRLLFRTLKERTSLGRVENILGTNHAEQGNLKQAHASFERALTALEHSEEPEITGCVLMNVGIVHNIMGQFDQALAYLKRAQSCFEEEGAIHRLAELHHNLGMNYLSRLDFTQALSEFETSLRFALEGGATNLVGLGNLGKANARFRMKDYPLAVKLVNKAMQAFSMSSDRLSLADSYKLKGMIHRNMGQTSSAESYLQTSLRMNMELNNKLNIAETFYEMGLLKKQLRKTSDATKAFDEAHRLFKRIGAIHEARKAQQELQDLRKV